MIKGEAWCQVVMWALGHFNSHWVHLMPKKEISHSLYKSTELWPWKVLYYLYCFSFLPTTTAWELDEWNTLLGKVKVCTKLHWFLLSQPSWVQGLALLSRLRVWVEYIQYPLSGTENKLFFQLLFHKGGSWVSLNASQMAVPHNNNLIVFMSSHLVKMVLSLCGRDTSEEVVKELFCDVCAVFQVQCGQWGDESTQRTSIHQGFPSHGRCLPLLQRPIEKDASL